jgi:hypothetical protein
MTGWWLRWSLAMTALGAGLNPNDAHAQARPAARPQPVRDSAARARANEEAAAKAFLIADDQFYYNRVMAHRAALLQRAEWAELGDRCTPGALRVFPRDTTASQRDSIQRLVERIEQTVISRGVGARLDTPEARSLLRTVVGWEAGIDRPFWDVDTKTSRAAIATGLTGDVPDPRGPGCLPSPLAADTVTFVLPGFATMDFPRAPRPRVKAYFGPESQKRARDEFFSAVGAKNPETELSYILIAPVVIWRDLALVGVDRPREKGGVEIGSASNGGAVYLMRKFGTQWRLLAVVRSWGS